MQIIFKNSNERGMLKLQISHCNNKTKMLLVLEPADVKAPFALLKTGVWCQFISNIFCGAELSKIRLIKHLS